MLEITMAAMSRLMKDANENPKFRKRLVPESCFCIDGGNDYSWRGPRREEHDISARAAQPITSASALAGVLGGYTHPTSQEQLDSLNARLCSMRS